MESLNPPMDPQVVQQQAMPPLRQFAQGGGMASAAQMVNQAPSMDLVGGLLDEVGGSLQKIATVLQVERPELIPLLVPVVQGLAMLAKNIKTAQGGAPQGGDTGTAPAGAPEAPGAAAMGMGQ